MRCFGSTDSSTQRTKPSRRNGKQPLIVRTSRAVFFFYILITHKREQADSRPPAQAQLLKINTPHLFCPHLATFGACPACLRSCLLPLGFPRLCARSGLGRYHPHSFYKAAVLFVSFACRPYLITPSTARTCGKFQKTNPKSQAKFAGGVLKVILSQVRVGKAFGGHVGASF